MQPLIRLIEPHDTPEVARVIIEVMSSYGAVGEGYSIQDAETYAMYEAYQEPRSRYYVVERGGEILGGGGVAQLRGGDPSVCELRKMYFLPEARGLGLGRRILELSLDAAREFGYTHCYLETLQRMTDAKRLYEKLGFTELPAPMGDTGHSRTDNWYLLDLTT